MNIFARFSLVLLVVCVGIAGAVGFSHRTIRQKIDSLLLDRKSERENYFTSAGHLQAAGLRGLVGGYAWWDQMLQFVETRDTAWANDNIDTLVGIPDGADSLWILGKDLQTIHTIDEAYRHPDPPFGSVEDFKKLAAQNYEFEYFTIINGELWQIFVAAIQDPSFWRNETPVAGYLIMGKEWDTTWLARLGALSQSHLSRHIPALTRPQGSSPPDIDSTSQFNVPITGLDGTTIASIRGVYESTVVEQIRQSLSDQTLIFTIGLVVFLALLAIFVGVTVMRPMGQIIRSLESRNPIHLSELLVSKSDFGEIARLLSSQFRQGRMLQEEIRRRLSTIDPNAETNRLETNEALRLRLASDLHDGPMQSIYAAGLKIGSMEAALTSGRAPDQIQLSSIRTILTECSNNLRNLLLDLEPEELREQDLEGAFLRFERYLGSISKVSSEFFIEDGVLDGVIREAQIHLYYITRELISNASRHARPTRTSLRFRGEAGFLVISWENDGFTPVDQPSSGSGLKNIAQRVEQLGGTWSQHLHRNKIWQIKIEIPFTAITGSIPLGPPG